MNIHRGSELKELVADLAVEAEEEWWGETITVRGANVRMSTRQFFDHINTFTANLESKADNE